MTSKNSFFDLHLYTDRLKRGGWLTGLIAGVLFFALPVTAALTTGNDARYWQSFTDMTTTQIQNRIDTLVQGSGVFVMALAVGFALLAALTAWSSLNSKQQVDFYHSLPISRQSLFSTSYACGITAFLAPLLIMQALSLLVITFNGFGSYLPWAMVGDYLLRAVVVYLSVFSLCTAACMLCGSTLVSFFGSAVFLAWPPLMVAMIASTFQSYYRTFFYNSDFWTPLYRRISPLADLFGTLGEDYYLLWWLLASVVLTGLSLLACVRRPSEGAGRAIVFPGAKPVIRLSLAAVSTLCMGYFFRELGNSDGWMLFGFFAGALFMSMLVQGIFAFDIRAVFKGMKSLAVFGVCFAAVFSIFYFDLTGYDAKLPQRGRVSEVGIYLSNTSRLLNQSGGMSTDHWFNDTAILKYMVFSDPEIIDLAVELAESGVQNLETDFFSDYVGGWGDVSLSFRQGSSKFTRTYRIPQSVVEEALERLYNNQSFKSRLYFAYGATSGEYKSMVLVDPFRESGSYNGTNYPDQQLVDDLLEALRQDIAATGAEEMKNARGLAMLTFSTSATPHERNTYPQIDRTVAVYDRYEQTLLVLQRYNIPLPQRPTAAEVSSIRIHYGLEELSPYYAELRELAGRLKNQDLPRTETEQWEYYGDEYTGEAYYDEEYYAYAEKVGYDTRTQTVRMSWREILVTDPDTINALISELEPSEPMNYNLFISTQNGLNIELYQYETLNYGISSCFVVEGRASELLLRLIVNDLERQLSLQAGDTDLNSLPDNFDLPSEELIPAQPNP